MSNFMESTVYMSAMRAEEKAKAAEAEERTMLPVRCFTCGKVLRTKDPSRYTRYCCKKVVKSFVDYYNEVSSRKEVFDALKEMSY